MRLIDLFCGAGGCAVGYHRAGFTEIVGVDNKPQPNYPFTFVQADALQWLRARLMAYRYDGCGFEYDAIHASPPCQAYTVARKIHDSGDRHPDLVDKTRSALEEARTLTGVPWVIENVPGAPVSGVTLCGLMFGLKVLRHRIFETSFFCMSPPHPKHPKGNLTNACHGYSTGETGFVCVAGNNFVREAGAKAMKIDWMKTRRELANAIPPAYTEFVGKQLVDHVRGNARPVASDRTN